MTKFFDKTQMGGDKEAFRTTCWTEIHNVGTDDAVLRAEITSNLLKKYWKPVYCHLRRKGYNNETAKDLTQGFFSDLVLGGKLIQHADKNKGRFRNFLLTALDRYAVNVYRKETAAKRSPPGQKVSLEIAEVPDLSIIETEIASDQAFHYTWASELLDQVLAKVKEDCYCTGKESHWEVFSDRVLAPIFYNEKAPPMTEICLKHGVENESKASNMIVTVKRLFHKLLEDQLRKFVQSEAEVKEEFDELIKILSKNSAR